MSSSEKQEPKLPFQNVVLLAGAIAGAVWLYQSPLRSSRPVDQLEGQKYYAGDRRVQARLWQDPFDAVETHILMEGLTSQQSLSHSKNPHIHSLTQLANEMSRSVFPPKNVQVLVLLSDGAPYADPSESRLRQRYALLAGLERAGYVPRDGEGLRFFQWGLPGSSANSSHSLWRTAMVPVEWFQSSNDPALQVLVLWVKDQDLGDYPLSSLRTIKKEVLDKLRLKAIAASVTIIGPRFSGTLQSMVSEAKGGSRTPDQACERSASDSIPLEIYSPWSTAPEELIHAGRLWEAPSQTISECLRTANVTFFRTISTDDGLSRELAEELGRREVTLGALCSREKPCNRIAIVSEWDTLYGRALPKIFKDAVLGRGVATNTGAEAARIFQFSYLRGLDGELPREKRKGGSEESSPRYEKASLSFKERRQSLEQLERPEGQSQLDYVRRLAQRIKDEEDRGRPNCPWFEGDCSEFKAIGILGSDVYDKLLIIQALKQSFPHAIFFTTDLDARLFHPSELPWTRNLVVASHFGLALNEKLQGGIPPFRDTYQTATFYAVMRALRAVIAANLRDEGYDNSHMKIYKYQPLGAAHADYFDASTQTRLHEIGRNGPVDLSIEREGRVERGPHIHSMNQPRLSLASVEEARQQIALFGVALAVGWLLSIPASQTVYRLSRNACATLIRRPSAGIVAILGLMAIGAFVCWQVVPYMVSDGHGGEPFSLFDGVSIWPSQVLRGAVGLLAAAFISKIWNRLRGTREEVETEFSELLRRTKSGTEGRFSFERDRPSWRMRIAKWCMSDRLRSVSGWALDPNPKEPAQLWVEYRERLAAPYLYARVLSWSAVFMATGYVVMRMCGRPVTPFRGMVAKDVNQWVLLAAILLMVVVIFLVLDVMRMTGAFVRKLVSHDLGSVNPEASLTKLQLVARLTARLDVLIYYPAVLLALMILARAHYLDNWDFPLGLMIVIGLGAGYVVASAVLLRGAAEEARRYVIRELSKRRWLADPQANATERIKQLLENIEALKEGAFVPYTELPVLRAVALPSGAYGVLALIELMSTHF